MDDDDISKEITRILRIIEDVPEEYKLKTYELLLSAYLQQGQAISGSKEPMEDKPVETDQIPEQFVVPIDVRAFLAQNQIPEEALWKLFLVQDSEIRPIYKIKTTKKAIAQIQITCLLALENALKGEKFEFSIETVRARLDQAKVYDSKNFSSNFTRKKALFSSLDDEHIQLSPVGKTELANIIEAIMA